jgi:hypothetical protein
LLGRFRRLSLKCWLKWRYPLRRSTVYPDEQLTRYLFSRGNEFTVANGTPRLKAAGLIPYKYVELSVYRVTGLDVRLIWRIGDVFVGSERRRPVLARAIFSASAVTDPLRVVANEPPPRHADILTWPTEKSLQLSIAQQLIKNGATVEIRTTTSV